MATKRELILDLLARDKSGTAVTGFSKKIKDVGDEADRASTKAKEFGGSTEVAAKGADKLGDEAAQTARQIDGLNDEIGQANRKLAELAAAFATAGSKAERLDISKQVRQVENDIRRMDKSKGILKSLLPDPDPGQTQGFVNKLVSSLNKGFASSPPAALAGGVLAAALAPTLLSGIAAAITGGVGLGGVVGGFALAAKDPKISASAKTIGKTFLSDIQKEAQDAFGGPVRESLVKLEDAAARSAPKIGKLFDNVAPGVDKFTTSVGKAVDYLLDAAVVVSGRSQPAIEGLGRLFEQTAESAGDFLEMISENSESSASALDDLAMAIDGVFQATGRIVEAGTTVKGWTDSLDEAIDKSRYWLEDQSGIVDLTADGYKKGSEAAELYRQGIIGVAGSANDYAAYIENASNATQNHADTMTTAQRAAQGEQSALEGLSNELRAQTDPVFGLLNAQDKLKEAQDKVKQSTKDHGEKSRETKAALRELAEAALEMEGRAGALGGSFSGKLTPQLRNTLRAAGLTDAQINSLGKQFSSAKEKGENFAKKYKARVEAEGAAEARRELNRVASAANSIPNVVSIAMRITGVTNVSKQAAAIRKNVEARATGGPVVAGTPYWVGENGPELIMPNSNGMVLSNIQSQRQARRLFSTPSFNTGGVSPLGGRIHIETAGPEEIRTFLRYMIRSMNLLQG